MLGKLIKYDLQFGAKKYAFMAAMTALLLIAAMITLGLKSEIVSALFFIFAVIATIAFGIVYLVISVQHLTKQLCSRESYLNYALPVSTHNLLLSKIISILFWGIVTTLIIVLFWVFAVNGIVVMETGQSLTEIWNGLVEQVRAESNGMDFGLIMFQSMIMGLIQFIMCIALAVFCVTLSNVPYLKDRNWGVAAGVVGFIVLYNVVSLIPVGIQWTISKSSGTDIFVNEIAGTEITQMMSSLSWVGGIAYIAFAVGFYFLSVILTRRQRAI